MHFSFKGHVFASRADALTIPELMAVSGVPDVCFGAFTKDEDIELLVLLPTGNVSVLLVPNTRLKRALGFGAARAADDATFDDPCFPDDIAEAKQLLVLRLYAERSHGSPAFAAIARGLAALLSGFYEIEGAYFTPDGKSLAVPKRPPRTRPDPPTALRVAQRALILSATMERRRAFDSGDRTRSIRAMVDIQKWMKTTNVVEELTREEQTFFQYVPATIGNSAWIRAESGYEAVPVLAWALGASPMPSPHERADPKLIETLGLLASAPPILEKPTLRLAHEIAALDAALDARQKRAIDALMRIPPEVMLDPRRPKPSLEESERAMIAHERRRAVKWLLGYWTSYADATGRT